MIRLSDKAVCLLILSDGESPGTAGGAVSDTRPRYGTAPAIPTASPAAVLAALIATGSNGSRVAGSTGTPLTLSPAPTDYGWFACLAIAAPSGITVNTALGVDVWDGATSAGQLFSQIDAGPASVTHAAYTDDYGNVWNLYRQELTAAAATFWTT